MPPASGPSTRSRPIFLGTLAAGLLVARLALGIYDARHPPPPGGLVRWTSLENAQIAAAIEKRPILYDFSASWCEPCRQMEREVFADAAAAGFINQTYLAIRVVDDDQSPGAVALRAHHGVGGLPTLVVVYAGDWPPARTEGYRGKGRTIAFLRQAAVPSRLPRLPF
jgi:thiol:disulfide interchange protein